MRVQRLSNSQILTDIPVDSAAESVWYAFEKFGVHNSIIDLKHRVIQGKKPKSLTAYGKIFTAQLEDSPKGLLISLNCKELMGGDIDLFGNRGIRRKLTTYIEEELRSNSVRASEKSVMVGHIAPIASPKGGPISRSRNEPVYGTVFIDDSSILFKHGMLVLFLGFFSVSLFTPLAPFVFGWGMRLFNDYRKLKSNDKSLLFDKSLLMIGIALSSVGTVKFIVQLLRS